MTIRPDDHADEVLVGLPTDAASAFGRLSLLGAAVRRLALALGLSLCLLGCGAAQASHDAAQASPEAAQASPDAAQASRDYSGPMGHMTYDLDPPGIYPCPATVWITGVIVKQGGAWAFRTTKAWSHASCGPSATRRMWRGATDIGSEGDGST
jgi:hypothetical protein